MVDSQDISEEIAKILAMVFPDCLIRHNIIHVAVHYEFNKYQIEVVTVIFYSPSGWYARIYDSDYMPVDDIITRLCSVFEMDLVEGSRDSTKACTYFIKGTTDGRSYINKHDWDGLSRY